MRKLYLALGIVALLCVSTMAFAANEPDLSGAISLVDYDAGTFFVAGTTVTTNEETIISEGTVAITFAQLADGDMVKVFGEVDADGNFVARKICKLLLLKDGSGKEIMEG